MDVLSLSVSRPAMSCIVIVLPRHQDISSHSSASGYMWRRMHATVTAGWQACSRAFVQQATHAKDYDQQHGSD